MHKLAEKIADCMKAKVEGMGIDNIEGQDLVELGMWTDIIKDLVCYDKDKKIIEAMDEAEESEEAMKYIEMYEDYPERKGYRGQTRDSMGRFTSRRGGRRGGRRGYEAPMGYEMTPEMYHMYPPEYWRDMDREEMGRMYYGGGSGGSQGGQSSGGSSGGMSGGSRGGSVGGSTRGYEEGYSRGYEEGRRENQKSSRSENARRGYEETKMMQDGSPESKKKAMESLENYMKELGEDMSELVGKMDSNEKNMLRTKLQTLAQKVQ